MDYRRTWALNEGTGWTKPLREYTAPDRSGQQRRFIGRDSQHRLSAVVHDLQWREAGCHYACWVGRNEQGRPLASATGPYRLRTGGESKPASVRCSGDIRSAKPKSAAGAVGPANHEVMRSMRRRWSGQRSGTSQGVMSTLAPYGSSTVRLLSRGRATTARI